MHCFGIVIVTALIFPIVRGFVGGDSVYIEVLESGAQGTKVDCEVREQTHGKLARPAGETLNLLFECLANWSAYFKAQNAY